MRLPRTPVRATPNFDADASTCSTCDRAGPSRAPFELSQRRFADAAATCEGYASAMS
jgi:hypothetical protein